MVRHRVAFHRAVASSAREAALNAVFLEQFASKALSPTLPSAQREKLVGSLWGFVLKLLCLVDDLLPSGRLDFGLGNHQGRPWGGGLGPPISLRSVQGRLSSC